MAEQLFHDIPPCFQNREIRDITLPVTSYPTLSDFNNLTLINQEIMESLQLLWIVFQNALSELQTEENIPDRIISTLFLLELVVYCFASLNAYGYFHILG